MSGSTARQIETPPEASKQFGRFKLVGPLGEGGMGRVFRAELSGPGGFRKALALKLLPESMVMETEDRGYILRHEARVGALLHHPNIVEVYDFGLNDGQPWISMELVEGTDLERLIRILGAAPPSVLVEIACQICDALAYAHDVKVGDRVLGLVHRDLKPSNVLISRDGHVKLADFGIARATLDGESSTSTGVAKGTPCYMSPEQARGLALDRRSDLFALGSVMYWMATGKILFRGKTAAATTLAILNVDRWLRRNDVVREVEERIPGLGDLLWRSLQREVARRPKDAREVAAELEGLRAQHASGPTARVWLQSQWELLAPDEAPQPNLRRRMEAFQLPLPPVAGLVQTAVSPETPPAETTHRLPVEDGSPPLDERPIVAVPIADVVPDPPWTRPNTRTFGSGIGVGIVIGLLLGVGLTLAVPHSTRAPLPIAELPWVPPLRLGSATPMEVPFPRSAALEPVASPVKLAAPRPRPVPAAARPDAEPAPLLPDAAKSAVADLDPGVLTILTTEEPTALSTGFVYEHQPLRWVPAGVERTFLLRIPAAQPKEVTLVIDAGGGKIRTSMSPRGGDMWTAKATLSPGAEARWSYWFEADVGQGPPLRLLDGGTQPWILRVGGQL